MIETNWFFLQKEAVIEIMMRHKLRTQWDRKSQNGGHHLGTSLPCPSMWVPSPGSHIAVAWWDRVNIDEVLPVKFGGDCDAVVPIIHHIHACRYMSWWRHKTVFHVSYACMHNCTRSLPTDIVFYWFSWTPIILHKMPDLFRIVELITVVKEASIIHCFVFMLYKSNLKFA